MATATTNSLSLASSSTLVDSRSAARQPASASPQCVTLPTLPPLPVISQGRLTKAASYCRKIARNVAALATGDVPAATAPGIVEEGTSEFVEKAKEAVSTPLDEPPTVMGTGEVPASASASASAYASGSTNADTQDFVQIAKEAWNSLEDKYAVVSLSVAGLVAAYGASGMISSIDRLPIVPGLLEIVGIGYTGYFAYKNLIFKPDRESFIRKSLDTYNNIIGTSGSSSY